MYHFDYSEYYLRYQSDPPEPIKNISYLPPMDMDPGLRLSFWLKNELKNSREELRNLSAHLQSVRDEERRCVASEIHDELGQVLTH